MAMQSNLRNARNTGLRNTRDYSPAQTAKPVACEIYAWFHPTDDGEANTLYCYSLNMDSFVDADRKKLAEKVNTYSDSDSAYRYARDGFYAGIQVFTNYAPNMVAGEPGDIENRNRTIIFVEEQQANDGSILYHMVDATSQLGMFPVVIEKDGGADATDGFTRATWTYTVTTLYGTTIGTAMSPKKPREYGRTQFQATSSSFSTIGVGYVDANGDKQLWDAGEVIVTADPCDPPTE